MRPSVSVVMSVYNAENFLKDAINSILDQSFTDFEFIIINDGSADRTERILKSYKDPRIILIHQENQGLTKSLNRGIAIARGRYIARQDADDISKLLRLEKQVAFLEAHPQVGLLGSRFEFIDEDGEVKRQSWLPTDNDVLQERLTKINQFCHTSIMMRKEALDKVGSYREFFRYAQDYDLWLRIAEHFTVANLPETLVQYRELSKAISNEKVLVQSQFAATAAELALQRRQSGTDLLNEGIAPPLLPVERFSAELQKKLEIFYEQHPESLYEGLRSEDIHTDLYFILTRIINEKLKLEQELQDKAQSFTKAMSETNHLSGIIRQKDEQLALKDSLLAQNARQIAENDIRFNTLNEEMAETDLYFKKLKSELADKDIQLNQLLGDIASKHSEIGAIYNSYSWKITSPLRKCLSIIRKR